MDGRMDGWMDGWLVGWLVGWIDGDHPSIRERSEQKAPSRSKQYLMALLSFCVSCHIAYLRFFLCSSSDHSKLIAKECYGEASDDVTYVIVVNKYKRLLDYKQETCRIKKDRRRLEDFHKWDSKCVISLSNEVILDKAVNP
ncbi:hypothetical protein DINM_006021 [Dirofilaria immitis]|nr:hypothetical protein [Dirofilaria immitis]